MNYSGLMTGVFALVAIGFGFFWVVKVEYYVGASVWRPIAVVGVLISALSGLIGDPFVSAGVGILGGTVVWGAFELPDQAIRVEKGMFRKNPKRKGKGRA